MSYNEVILEGRLTADPELRYIPSGKAVATFNIAVDRPTKEGQEKVADFFSVTAWEKQADWAVQFLSKGSPVGLRGRLRLERWEQEGQKRQAVKVVASSLYVPIWSLEKAGAKPTAGASPEPDDGEDVPF